MPCNVVVGYQRFRVSWFLHLQGELAPKYTVAQVRALLLCRHIVGLTPKRLNSFLNGHESLFRSELTN